MLDLDKLFVEINLHNGNGPRAHHQFAIDLIAAL